MKITKQRIDCLQHLLYNALPAAPIIKQDVELDDEDVFHQIILISPFWTISRIYTDMLETQIQEMSFLKVGLSFNNKHRY